MQQCFHKANVALNSADLVQTSMQIVIRWEYLDQVARKFYAVRILLDAKPTKCILNKIDARSCGFAVDCEMHMAARCECRSESLQTFVRICQMVQNASTEN